MESRKRESSGFTAVELDFKRFVADHELDGREETPPPTRGVVAAEQVAAALKATLDDHLARHKANGAARKTKTAADVAELLGDGAPRAEMSRNAEPPSLRENATRAHAPRLGGGRAASAPKAPVPKAQQAQQAQQKQNFQQQRLQRGPLRQRPGLRRKSHSHGPSPVSVGASSGPPPTARPEPGVSEERFSAVQRRAAETKAKHAGETATAKQSRESEGALALKAIMELGRCPYDYRWFHNGCMWEYRTRKSKSI
jgi:hypothetical protein